MLKLLTNEEKINIKKEYVLKLLTVLFFGLAGVFVLILVAFIPSYYILKIDQDVLNQELSVAQDTELNVSKKRLKEKLSNLKQALNIVDTEPTKISVYIQKITERQPAQINILNMNFSKLDKKESIAVQGNADNRVALVSFISSLEEVEEFGKINLPFSSFTRDSDIPFSITINIVDKTKDEK